ncbi:hypothetical protein FGIG_12030 [Fasciola gigantica]|uniref:Uncharacterized protein n=1 Tax=Fasciola gigantica TaxID=46835 RepID=A0A504YEJ0_FASGI|nr:hypothetical protein FGIG_12030 [Fasciola gigantica]
MKCTQLSAGADKFRRIRNECKSEIRLHAQKGFLARAHFNKSILFKHIYLMRRTKSYALILRLADSTPATLSKQVIEIFGVHFRSIFDYSPTLIYRTFPPKAVEQNLDSIHFSVRGVELQLKHVNLYSPTDPDDIHPRILK